MISQRRSRRKVSGGRYKKSRKKRLSELGRMPSLTKIGKTRLKRIRVKGGDEKFRLFAVDTANVFDPKTKSYSKAKILSVVESPANRHYIRRNIMTKGTIIDTEKGKTRITSRPGQEGAVNAVLVK